MTDTKFVAGDGTGDFNCDGSDDQEGINKALSWAASNPGNRVHLIGNYEYQITNQILMGADTVFSGDATAVLKVPNMACGTTFDNCVFPDGTPVLGALPGVIPNNVELTGFTFDGNCQNQALKLGLAHGKPSSAGSGVERLIELKGTAGNRAKNISINNITFRDAFGEAAHLIYCENVQIYNNFASNHQHDAFFCREIVGTNVMRNNIIEGITDGCARLDNCRNWEVYENLFKAYTGDHNNTAQKLAHNGMQIANEANKTTLTNNINVFNNKFIGPNLCGIWLNDQLKKAGTAPQSVRIHHNIFENCAWSDWGFWSSGIGVGPWGNGIKIDHNTFNGCYNNSIQFINSIATGCIAEVYYNNITNTKGTRTGSTTAPSIVGYGIMNSVSTSMTVQAECNYMAGNKAGDYYKVTPGSIALDAIPDATVIIEVDPVNAVDVIVTCKESELEGFLGTLTQNYIIYDEKV